MNGNNGVHEQSRRLARVLVAQHDNESCLACLDQLEDYVGAQLEGAAYQALFPEVAQHMDGCVACAESYTMLYEVRRTGGVAPVPARIPEPDVSFLQSDVTGRLTPRHLRVRRAAARLREAVAGAVERVGAHLRLTFSQVLLDLLPARPALAMRSADEGETLLFDLKVEEPQAEVTLLHLAAYLVEGVPGRCTIRVQLALKERAWPALGEVPVLLLIDGEQRRALTDPWGEAVFGAVPLTALPRLQVDIDTGGAPTSA